MRRHGGPPAPAAVRLACAALLAALAATATGAGLKLPPTARAWTGSDYAKAAVVLAAAGHPLPRLDGEAGQRLFARLTALGNLSPYADRHTPVETRLADCLALQRGTSAILRLYAREADTQGTTLGGELAALQAFSLHAATLGLALVAEVVSTLPADGGRLAEFARTASGFGAVFLGAATTLGNRTYYEDADRAEILDALSVTLPRALPALPGDFRDELRKRLVALPPTFTGARAHNQLDVLIALLDSA